MNTDKTTAEHIADLFGNDGQKFKLDEDRWLDDVCQEHGGKARGKWGPGTTPVRWVFGDGSAIVTTDGGWDFGFDEPDESDGCFCWYELGHEDDCELVPDGYSVYHSSSAGNPACHVEDRWYYQPDDYDGDVYSPPYSTYAEAAAAARQDDDN